MRFSSAYLSILSKIKIKFIWLTTFGAISCRISIESLAFRLMFFLSNNLILFQKMCESSIVRFNKVLIWTFVPPSYEKVLKIQELHFFMSFLPLSSIYRSFY